MTGKKTRALSQYHLDFLLLISFLLNLSVLSFAGEDAAQHLLYHFNGLEAAGRLARLTPLKLMPRSSENAIGVSVALGGQSDNGPSGFSNAIEEVRDDFTFYYLFPLTLYASSNHSYTRFSFLSEGSTHSMARLSHRLDGTACP